MQNTINTNRQYEDAVQKCRDIFLKKTKDYGTAWRVLRIISVTDQIFIKAQRIRTLQEKQQQRVGDDIPSELKGIVNYGIIGLIQLELGTISTEDLSVESVAMLYNENVEKARQTMEDKNHDYGEAWRDMLISSFTDLILMRILRIRQIEEHEGRTLVSEGIDSNLYDIINYAIFALIKISEQR